MSKALWPREVPDSDSLIINFLKSWEASWCERTKFIPEQLLTIRTSLFAHVAYRYSKSGEIFFTRSELKEAITAASNITEPQKIQSFKGEVNPICHAYVFLFIQRWENAKDFSPDELSTIFAYLYLYTVERYEESNRSKLFVTKREIKKAVETVESLREKRAKEAYQDSRDKQIRELRNRYGTVAEARAYVSE